MVSFGEINECHQEVACQEEHNPGIHAAAHSGNPDITEVVKDEGDNPQESITEATATEGELQKGHPRVDAFTNFRNPDILVLAADVGENSTEPPTEPSSAEMESEKSAVFPQLGDQMTNPAVGETSSWLKNDVSELKPLEEVPKRETVEYTCMQDNVVRYKTGEGIAPEDEVFVNELPKGILDENTDIQDSNLVKNLAGGNQVLAQGYLESEEELAELSQAVLDDNDNESNKHLRVAVEEDTGKTDAVTMDVNAEAADSAVPNTVQTEPRQEKTLKVPATSEVNESLGYAEDEKNNVELLKVVDLGSKDSVLVPEEKTSVKSDAVDEPEGRGKEGTGSEAEVFYFAKPKVIEYSAEENEIPGVTSTIEPKEASETCLEEASKFSFTESEGGCSSGGENRLTVENNSSSEDASRPGDFPLKSSKLCDAEHGEMQVNGSFALQACGEAAGVDGTFAQTCDSGAWERQLSDHTASVPLEAKKSEEEYLSPSSPTSSQISLQSDTFSDGDKKLIEENARLREMMQKLIEAGQEHLTAISNLSARVKSFGEENF